MPKSFIVFNGQSSAKFGLTVEELPDSNHPERRAEPYQIEGRNGSFVHEDGVFENYEQGYAFNTRNITTGRNTYQTARDIAAWLLSSSGYCRLEDTYEPEYYRLARFAGPFNVENILRRYGRGTLSFDCRPERYLKSGEKAITLFESLDLATPDGATAQLKNPCAFSATPVVRITAKNVVRIVKASSPSFYMDLSIDFGNIEKTVVIDCEKYTIDNIDPVNITYNTPYPMLMTLTPNNNQIAVMPPYSGTAGYISQFEIIPRWWTV